MGADALLDGEPNPSPPSILDELMTAEQVADVLQLRQSTVEDYARREVLPSIKLGRHRRFVRSEVERAIIDLTMGPRRARPSSGRR